MEYVITNAVYLKSNYFGLQILDVALRRELFYHRMEMKAEQSVMIGMHFRQSVGGTTTIRMKT